MKCLVSLFVMFATPLALALTADETQTQVQHLMPRLLEACSVLRQNVIDQQMEEEQDGKIECLDAGKIPVDEFEHVASSFEHACLVHLRQQVLPQLATPDDMVMVLDAAVLRKLFAESYAPVAKLYCSGTGI